MHIEDFLTRRANDIDRNWKDQAIEFLQTYANGQTAKIKDLEREISALKLLVVEQEQEGFRQGDPERMCPSCGK